MYLTHFMWVFQVDMHWYLLCLQSISFMWEIQISTTCMPPTSGTLYLGSLSRHILIPSHLSYVQCPIYEWFKSTCLMPLHSYIHCSRCKWFKSTCHNTPCMSFEFNVTLISSLCIWCLLCKQFKSIYRDALAYLNCLTLLLSYTSL